MPDRAFFRYIWNKARRQDRRERDCGTQRCRFPCQFNQRAAMR